MKGRNPRRAYQVVDAFSAVPFKDNPVVVVLDAIGLSDVEMQAIARAIGECPLRQVSVLRATP
jgi:predicted PhzF superfamily epimerase YddE/YHI9